VNKLAPQTFDPRQLTQISAVYVDFKYTACTLTMTPSQASGDLSLSFTATAHAGKSHAADWSSLIGIITAIVGNILISFALNIQRYAHIRLDQELNEKKYTQESGAQSGETTVYGTQQEQIAEGRSELNAKARGPGNPADGKLVNGHKSDEEDTANRLTESFQSDATLQSDGEEEDQRKSYLRSPTWWLGIVLMTVGETGNFLAYGFAPASIVSPLGVVALISNCLIAPLMLKERFRQRDFWGVVIAIGGAVTVVLSAKQGETKIGPGELWKNYIQRWEFLAYVIITVVSIAALMALSPRYGTRTILVDLGLVGLFGGYTALSTKGVASLLSTSLYKAFTYPIFYPLVLILVASAIMQIRYLNRALQNFDSTQVIPTQFVMFTLSVIIGSAVLYRDFESTTLQQAIKFVAGCLLTFFGVYLITSGRQSHDDDDEAEDDKNAPQDETIQLIDEEADERTPLARKPSKKDRLPSSLRTPPMLPTPESSEVPSIAVTPADDSPNPWMQSASDLSTPSKPSSRPKTPIRSHSDIAGTTDSTPFFTPSTSQPLRRAPSVHGDPSTPTRSRRSTRAASPPNPDPEAAAAAAEMAPSSTIRRSARDSILSLVPGPLLPPLSSSLSGIVADSLLRGEGSPLSVRKRLLRNRSSKYGTIDDIQSRRRSDILPDEEQGLGSTLRRHMTNIEATNSAPDVTADGVDASSLTTRKKRLRSLSETLGNIWNKDRDRRKGKRRDNDE
jgi:magnesium transporter